MRNPALLAALLPCFLFACSTSSSESPADPKNDTPAGIEEAKSGLERDLAPVVSDSAKTKLIDGNTDFAIALFKQSAKADQNLVQSPHSISTALAMVFAGAAAQTKTDIATALHYELADGELHPAFDWLDLQIESRAQDALGKDGKPARVHVDNLLFGANDATFGDPFLDTLAVSYGAGVQRVDFADIKTTDTINSWVADRTEQRIPKLLGPLDSSTRLVLVNTVYVNSAWSTPFEASATQDGTFTAPGGARTAAFMHQTQGSTYAETETAQMVEIPLSTTGLRFDVILPKGDLSAYEAALTPASFAALYAESKYAQVELALPKLKLEPQSDGSIKSALSALGMASAFGGGADFSPMMPNEGVMLTDVVHKTFFEIDEAGLEAAAATAVMAGETAAPQEPVSMHVDKPFLVVLRDEPTGQVLFLGHIVDPTAK